MSETPTALLGRAFAELEKGGMVARLQASCCRGCAGHELANELKAEFEAGKRDPTAFGGVVFTTQDDFRPGHLYLPFGPIDIDGTEYGPDAAAVGRKVVAALEAVGLEVQWDGSGSACIKVLGEEDYPPEEPWSWDDDDDDDC